MKYDSGYWNEVASEIPLGQDYDIMLAEHYRNSHLELIERWLDLNVGKKVLKTDLFAEAMCPARSFFLELVQKDCSFTAADISSDICLKANININHSANPVSFISADMRSLPFENNSFDIIISDSTLDHYKIKEDIAVSLKEFSRILKPGGELFITLDNKKNITEPLFRIYIALGLSPFFIGKTFSMKELKQALITVGFKVIDENYLIHNPRFFARLFIKFLRKLDKEKSTGRIKRMLGYFDTYKKKKTGYLTSQFIAVKAIKI